MREHGSSTLLPDESGRVMERLAGLERVISPEVMRQVLIDTGRVNERDCPLSHEVMLWVVVAMGLLTDLSIRQVFQHARRWRRGKDTPVRSSLCMARQRLGVEPLRELFARIVKPLATLETPGAFYHEYRLMGIDGCVFDVPDSAANAEFGRAVGGRGEGAFPQVRKLSLVELGTHVEVAFVLSGWATGEQTLAPQLWPLLPVDSLLLEDRGFFSFTHWESLISKVKLLCRAAQHLILKPQQKLADGSYLSQIYADPRAREADRDGLVVRVIEYTLDDPQRTGHGEVHRLLTNLLDEVQFPAHELIVLYHERWEHELVFDEQKTHQDPRRAEKPAHLRSETPAGVRQEMYALSLGHFIVRALMFAAARTIVLDVDRLSFTNSLQILQCRLPECDTRTPETLTQWYTNLLQELLQTQHGPRRNRVNPRVIKRKMSKWPKKHHHHRRSKQLLKRFKESIVMAK